MFALSRLSLLSCLVALPVLADGPKDNLPDNVRPVPPVGVELPAADADEIKAGLAELQREMRYLTRNEFSPDVEIYEKAVRYAVEYREVFNAKEIPAVKKVLKEGLERAKQLKAGQFPWAKQTGYVVRGYRSKIDGSAQPYGLHVPKDYNFAAQSKHRLDFWWHGRGETLSEVNFIANQQNAGGIIPAPGAFILAPYGRYCNANKFAGEVDTLECLEHAKRHYRIDENRLVARGFSMGGAACWQFAVHYPRLWCAAAPGAGFSETPEFLNVFQNEKVEPAWYEKKLWHLYNATDTAVNLFNLPTVAYSGADDRQKQAADVMAREMKKLGLELDHVIGPKTGHTYEKGAKAVVNEKIDAIAAKGLDPFPKKLKFATYTLKYNEIAWVKIVGMEKHWERATMEAEFAGNEIRVKTSNVSEIEIKPSRFVSAEAAALIEPVNTVVVDDHRVANLQPGGPGPSVHLVKTNGKWGREPFDIDRTQRRKVHGLQGPIDDAFMGPFVMVKPTGPALNDAVGKWVEGEMKHAVEHWRKQFRGDAPVKDDTAVNDIDVGSKNLILWGDPSSNAVLKKIADKLPIKWTADGVTVGDKTYPAGSHVPVFIFPNPYNPLVRDKYVVINSGFTFREYDYLNNARQVPKLPDYAVIDVTTPPNSRYPGKVVRAGFFGEKWELLEGDGK